ncbi:MAG: tRNA (N(6)-L-threonylcarbamoyladenosine(37)-C(2))-methylthiotransferase MtaB [Calditrichia bacterium]
MNTKVSFYTLGCRLNQAETATLESQFEKLGYQVVDFKSPSDVVIVNTCTVTENGDADTRKLVNKINRLNPNARIALIGCQAQVQRDSLLEMPNVKWVVGNALKMDLPAIIGKGDKEDAPSVLTPVIKRERFTHPVAGIDRRHTRANLKIQDGCDFFCSFCVIPYARGRARSREFTDVVREARQLAEAGHREVVLTGINVGTYRDGEKRIEDVIHALIQIEQLDRIRISSIEPTTIPEDLLNLAAARNKLCRYFHIPLQSGSNSVLKAMNRRYTREEFAEFIEYVDARVPNVCQGTDVIVGFPGEKEEHFEETYRLLEALPLAYFHVFSYSERPWAKSRKLEPKVPDEVIEKRSRILRELSQKKRNRYMESQAGREELVLFEQKKRGLWSGLTDTYIRVNVKSDLNLKNELVPVRLQRPENQVMIGELI